MATIWTYGGVDIYVHEDSGKKPEPRIDYVNPITTLQTTYIHQAGRESYGRTIKCKCVQNYAALLAVVDGASHVLVSDQGSLGDWVVLGIKGERIQDSRPLPVVEVTLDLMEVD